MEIKFDLKKILKRKKEWKKDDYIINPNFYWRIVVYFVHTILFISFGFGFYLFTTIGDEPTQSDSSIGRQASKIKSERVLHGLEYFRTRQKISQSILYTEQPVSDPSIKIIATPETAPAPAGQPSSSQGNP